MWRSWNHKEEAAEALKLTADHMLEFGLIDDIIKEPLGGAHSDPEKMIKTIRAHIKKEIHTLMDMNPDERIKQRIEKYSNMGQFDIVTEEEPEKEEEIKK